jgi:hypothetical protein
MPTAGDCPLLPGCYNLAKPLRCWNSNCVDPNQTPCPEIKIPANCGSNETRCADGVCRNECLPINGCPIKFPFHCADGKCTTNQNECAGYSDCPLTKPFRCADSSCVTMMTLCKRSSRSYSAQKMLVDVNVLNKYEVEFAFSASGSVVGKIIFPSNSIKKTDSNYRRTLNINPVSESSMRKISNIIPNSFKGYVLKKFPLNQNSSLDYHYSVLSPVLNISLQGID